MYSDMSDTDNDGMEGYFSKLERLYDPGTNIGSSAALQQSRPPARHRLTEKSKLLRQKKSVRWPNRHFTEWTHEMIRPPTEKRKDFTTRKGFELSENAYLRQDVAWRIANVIANREMRAAKCNETPNKLICLRLKKALRDTYALSSKHMRQKYWPSMSMLARESRKLYFRKVELLYSLSRITKLMNGRINNSTMAEFLTPGTMLEKFAGDDVYLILSNASLEYTLNCILTQIRAMLSTTRSVQWSTEAKLYLRYLVDHIAKSALNTAQLARCRNRKITAQQITLLTTTGYDTPINNGKIFNVNDSSTAYLYPCADGSETTTIGKDRRSVKERRAQKNVRLGHIPYSLSDLAKLGLSTGSADLEEPKLVLHALNVHVYNQLSHIVYGAYVRLTDGDKKSATRSPRVSLRLLIDQSLQSLRCKNIPFADGNLPERPKVMTLETALSANIDVMTFAHERINLELVKAVNEAFPLKDALPFIYGKLVSKSPPPDMSEGSRTRGVLTRADLARFKTVGTAKHVVTDVAQPYVINMTGDDMNELDMDTTMRALSVLEPTPRILALANEAAAAEDAIIASLSSLQGPTQQPISSRVPTTSRTPSPFSSSRAPSPSSSSRAPTPSSSSRTPTPQMVAVATKMVKQRAHRTISVDTHPNVTPSRVKAARRKQRAITITDIDDIPLAVALNASKLRKRQDAVATIPTPQMVAVATKAKRRGRRRTVDTSAIPTPQMVAVATKAKRYGRRRTIDTSAIPTPQMVAVVNKAARRKHRANSITEIEDIPLAVAVSASTLRKRKAATISSRHRDESKRTKTTPSKRS